MPLYKRHDTEKIIEAAGRGEVAPVYLIHGERYLCRQVADSLIARLLPDEGQRRQNLQTVDGEQEDPAETLSQLRSYGLFPGRRVFRVLDTKLFYSKGVAKTFWDKAASAAADSNLPEAGRCLRQMLGLAGLGDEEGAEIAGLPENRWRSLFGFAKPQGDLGWIKPALAAAGGDAPAAARPQGEPADLYVEALTAGLPAANVLILLAEAIDKRKRLYKYLQEHAVVVDLSVDTGSSSAARKDQDAVLRDLVGQTLAGFGKEIDSRALTLLLERVGFHPVAVVMEAEKLALATDEAHRITADDLEGVIGRTREEALFTFTEAFGSADLPAALGTLARLREDQLHPLVVVAGLRNHLRKLLFIRALQNRPHPGYRPNQQYGAFQKGYLPRLKEALEPWPQLLAGHPFVLYKLFRQAERFSLAQLKKAMRELLETEFRLKGSALPDQLILENLLFTFFMTAPEGGIATSGGTP